MSNRKKEEQSHRKRLWRTDTVSFTPQSASAEGDIEDKLRDAELRRAELKKKLRQLPSRATAMWRAYRDGATQHVREGLIGFALGLCAYLLGSCLLPFDTYPLGLALLCASPKKIIWIFFGLCASALTIPDGAFIYIFAYATAVAVRILARLLIDPPNDSGLKKRSLAIFTESIYLRMATGCATAFTVGLYFLTVRGFVFYDLFAAIFMMLCTPVAVFVYSGCFEENHADERFKDPAIAAFTVSLTYSLRGMSFIGISLGIFFAFFVTLYACRRKGLWQGLVLGLLCGVAYAPQYAPMFALSGLVASLMWSISSAWAMTAACAVAVMWGFYVEGTASVSHVLPAVMLSAVAYGGARKLSFFPAAKDLLFSGRYCSDMNDADMCRMGRRESDQRLRELSETFESLSEIFYNLSDRLSRPGLPELRRMCDGVYDKYCPSCQNREMCWEIEYSASADLIGSIGDMLLKRGIADVGDLPEYMRVRCVALPGIIGEINRKCNEMTLLSQLSDKSGVFAMDYSAVSDLLSDASARSRDDMIPDKELAERLTAVLSKYGFGEGGVSVYGGRRKRIIARGFDVSVAGGSANDLKKQIGEACGFAVSDPVIELGEGRVTVKLSRARAFSAKCVTAVNNTGNEECGDTVSTFETGEDKLCALISDGMGRGREAAFTSGVCSMFIQKMLGCGNRADTVIKMLGNLVRSKPGECSATVDLMELDLLNGRVELYKCGAAASFVRRGENLFKLATSTVPLGILTASDVGKLSFDARVGDVMILLSDGVALGNDDSVWLLDLLTGGFDSNLEVMAEKIIAESRRHGSDDDISVILVRLDGEVTK